MDDMEEPTLKPSFEHGVIGVDEIHWPSATVYMLQAGVKAGIPEAIAEWNRQIEEANGNA